MTIIKGTKQKGELLFCRVKLGGSPITVMLDDGAEVSLIRRDVAIKLQHSKTVEWEEGIITGSTPGSRQVNGAINTDLVIGEREVRIFAPYVVAPNNVQL